MSVWAPCRRSCRLPPFPVCSPLPRGSPWGEQGGREGLPQPSPLFCHTGAAQPMPPPPSLWMHWGGLSAPSGDMRTRALSGALVASRALVMEIASGGVCAHLASPAAWDASTKPSPAGCACYNHARNACATMCACAASMQCPS